MRMARYGRELCGGPITWGVIHRPVYPWHLGNREEDRANTLTPNGYTHIATKTHVAR